MTTTPAQASQPVSLSDAQIAYLSDVLGVHSLILPELLPAQAASVAAIQTEPSSDAGRSVRLRRSLRCN